MRTHLLTDHRTNLVVITNLRDVVPTKFQETTGSLIADLIYFVGTAGNIAGILYNYERTNFLV